MKIVLPVFIMLLGLSSCQTYQYLTVSGKNISQDSSWQFVAENDTVWVQYNFNGYNGPVKLSVYNKTEKPLYVDWRKSAIIIMNKAFSYYSPDRQLEGTTLGSEMQWNNGFNTQSGSLQAVIKGQEGIDFIPPHSMKEKTSLFILNGFLEEIAPDRMKRRYIDGDRKNPKVKVIDFSPDDSPVNFRSYLTFSTTGELSGDFSMEHQFYVSQLFLSTMNPSDFPQVQDQGNKFYTSRVSGFSKGVGVLAGVCLLTGFAIGSSTEGN